MPYPSRSYLLYVDDSGNENVGWLWTALAIPAELWTDHLRRWLAFRRWLYKQHGVPADFELHAQVWLSVEPEKQTSEAQLALVVDGGTGDTVDVLRKGRDRRRTRFEILEKAIKTIGSLPEASLFTTFVAEATGPAKIALYDDLLCFVEAFLLENRAHGTFIVDGLDDSGGHLRASHRALLIGRRRILEDAAQRSSSDSQLLQMADCCAYAALQSIQRKATFNVRFHDAYEKLLGRIVVQPPGTDAGRSIRGYDYVGDASGCPSERVNPPDSA